MPEEMEVEATFNAGIKICMYNVAGRKVGFKEAMLYSISPVKTKNCIRFSLLH